MQACIWYFTPGWRSIKLYAAARLARRRRLPEIPTSPQPGEHYDLLDLGLFRAPRWTPTV